MIEIIPAIDIINGKCVRLSKGDYNQQTIYNENPLEVAKSFEDHGLTRLHLVDLDGAKSKQVINWKILETIAGKTSLTIDFGGGIKSDSDLQIVFEHGAQMATVGSVAVKEPELFQSWVTRHGPEKIILGADVRDHKIAISGWLDNTDLEIDSFIDKNRQAGVKKVLCTDISKDGMLEGTSLELYKKIKTKFPDIYLIASGGITHINELALLEDMKVPAVIIGKAIYEGRIALKELEKWNSSSN
ncbi:MAG: 1-(5-phosphoribosyl)-5-[(5-phosphoribosylamino)methylideneamino]imidazole-4-carboxamide isomerase [Bacteroidetes bacterium]|jgi:phosphoribosylformimino-5-aminoimidazole carboxamide ribotide isomerase|nr:1-(5-phosphoribosyl)-5-[(5-phosphoribosylamino)methylideneamino]imidazole-4-carboxamide isomerase [Bacteroidota bacterium]